MARVLVLGASGYIGSHLVPRLIEAGHAVRAAARRRESLEGRGWDAVELGAADALDPASLDQILDGIEAVYYLVHSMGSGGDFAHRDRDAARNVRNAAARAGVERIVYLGGLQGGDSQHLRSRRETGDVLREGPVPVTELRAGIIVGAGSAAFEVIRDLVNHLPVMITPRWVRSRSQPIALGDVLDYLVRLLDTPATAGHTYDVGGPDVLSYQDLMKRYARVAGKRRLILPVPVLTPRVSSYWLDLVTTVPASVARPLIDGLKHDLLADDAAIRALIPMPLTPYDQAITDALRDEREHATAARWTEGALAFRGWDPEVSFYSKGSRTETPVAAPPAVTWSIVSSLGGKRGYYYANSLWTLRGLLDRLVGGVGMRRGRRHPVDLRVGDAVDFWRVAALEPGRRLTLVAEMRLPGSAVLEFEVSPRAGGESTLVMTSRFHPAGVFGLLYWYALYPPHSAIFKRTPLAMARAAERRARSTRRGQPTAA